MVSILKDIPIDGVKIVPCRVNGPRGIVKSFLVTGDQRLILVDTGFSDADADIIMEAIKDMGHKHEELKLCVLTHRHGDHTGGLKKLKKTLKFEVMAHELDMPAIQKATGYDVEHVVKGGERLPDCGGINVLHTPGHTAGHQLALAAHQDDDRRRRDRKRGRASGGLASLSFLRSGGSERIREAFDCNEPRFGTALGWPRRRRLRKRER